MGHSFCCTQVLVTVEYKSERSNLACVIGNKISVGFPARTLVLGRRHFRNSVNLRVFDSAHRDLQMNTAPRTRDHHAI